VSRNSKYCSPMNSHENNKGKSNSNITGDQKETTTQGTFLNQRTTQMTMAPNGRGSKPDDPAAKPLDIVSGTTKKSMPFVECNFTEAATPVQFSNDSTMPPARPKINLLDLNKVKQMSSGAKRYMMDTITSRTKQLKEGSARNAPQVDQTLDKTNKAHVAKRKKTKPAKAPAMPPRPQIPEPRSPTALNGYQAFSPLSSGRRHYNMQSFPDERNCVSPPLGRETLLSPRVKQSIENIRGKMEKSQINLKQTKQQLAAVTSKEMFLQSLQKSATLCHLAPGDSHWDQLMRTEEPHRRSAKSKTRQSKSQLSFHGEKGSDTNCRT